MTEVPYHTETSPLICRANQWTSFYMTGASAMKELKLKQKHYSFWLRSFLVSCFANFELLDSHEGKFKWYCLDPWKSFSLNSAHVYISEWIQMAVCECGYYYIIVRFHVLKFFLCLE